MVRVRDDWLSGLDDVPSVVTFGISLDTTSPLGTVAGLLIRADSSPGGNNG
jgi:hypothetical protein